ncbi:hypothetical protein [Paenibacillus sp. RC84]|uniref:hypothetical protein n=1 Tax=Paenibacillus sp. RC84 TaxID=3156252 RepID=UPI0035133444
MNSTNMIALSSLVLIALVIVGLEISLYIKFKKKLLSSFKHLTVVDVMYEEHRPIESLYNSYKKIPKAKFKIVMMSLRSEDNTTNFISTFIDLLVKLIFTTILAALSASVAVSSTSLNALNANREYIQTNTTSWSKSVGEILEGLKLGIETYFFFYLVAALIFMAATIDIFFTYKKQRLLKMHLTIIDQIEKEYK